MKRFVESLDRGQSTLFPETLDDFVDEDNPVRVIEAFVEALDLGDLGFSGVDPKATGRPSYHPVRRHINWNNPGADLREDLAHLVQDVKQRICGIASAGSPSFSV